MVAPLALLLWSLLDPVGVPREKPPSGVPPQQDITQCAVVTGSVRAEAYGYTHVVTLQNRCDKPVACEVWTDVDPEPRKTLRAAPGQSDEVITRRGSPARDVTAYKACSYQSLSR
jgi:hypothetical protein